MRVLTVKRYGDEYKITEYAERNSLRRSPVEVPSEETERFDSSISRARSRIFELARCNAWEYFCTLTLSSEYDRGDLNGWQKAFSQWLRDYRKKGHEVHYLLVPEQHKDGSWHMHGFFSGIGEVSPFEPCDIGDSLTDAAVKTYKAAELNREGYLNWRDYSRKWGYCSLAPVRNIAACSRYITKYITKELAMNNLISGAHLFYASRGLQSAELMAASAIPVDEADFRAKLQDCKHFCNEYVEQWWTDDPSKIALLSHTKSGNAFDFTVSEQ